MEGQNPPQSPPPPQWPSSSAPPPPPPGLVNLDLNNPPASSSGSSVGKLLDNLSEQKMRQILEYAMKTHPDLIEYAEEVATETNILYVHGLEKNPNAEREIERFRHFGEYEEVHYLSSRSRDDLTVCLTFRDANAVRRAMTGNVEIERNGRRIWWHPATGKCNGFFCF